MEVIKQLISSQLGISIITITIFSLAAYIGYKLSIYALDVISHKIDPTALHWHLIRYFVKVAWTVILIIGVIAAIPSLKSLGNAVVACSSVVVAALGLASQDALRNAIDGIFISIFKPFAVGDRVRLLGREITGNVEDINFRFTSIRTVENNLLMIPNSVMNSEIIENSNIIDTKIKAFLDVTIGYDSDIPKVKEILTDMIVNHPLFVDIRTEKEIEDGKAPVTVMVRNLGANGVEVRATVCSANIGNSFQLCSDLREEILIKFKENDIIIPYQTITISEKKV